MISPPLLVTLSLAALSASLALLMAHLGLTVVADLFAISGALLGLAAFVSVALSTVRSARRLPSSAARP